MWGGFLLKQKEKKENILDIFSGLNPAQKRAVEHRDGPLLIMAGAGSGKTKVLTCRIANLLAHGVQPWHILAITFTNKAATEMRERVDNLIGELAKEVWLSTFHSFCARFLRREIEGYGKYKHNFVIYDTTDSQTVIKQCIKEMNLDDKQYTPNHVLNTISNAKNQMQTPAEYARLAGNFHEEKLAALYELYQKKLQENNAMDFDDLLMISVQLLQDNEEIRTKYQRRFQYILVDEYQDTNGAQYQLTKLLAAGYRNLCVVGDADQSIYGWRGADMRNILDFEKDYPEATVIKLEQNYRSTKTILAAANAVIEHNINRKPKKLWTENAQGEPLTVYEARDERDEADYIDSTIEEMHSKQNVAYGDVAILYRTNAQSRVIEETFMRRGLPYTMVGGLKFYDRKEIKDILAYLRLIYNPLDTVSLLRVINTPKRGIGATSIARLTQYAEESGQPLFAILANPDELAQVPGLTARASKPLLAFASMIFSLMGEAPEMHLDDLVEKVLDETKYIEELQKDKKTENESRIENLHEFVGVARDFEHDEENPDLETFLSQLSLVSDIDNADMEDDRVTLMTLHAAKGLEFPVVFMAGMEEGLFPHSRTLTEPDEMEEERRTCYVGITRAQRKLYLTYARQRMLYGRPNAFPSSRFLAEIPEEYKEELVSDGYGAFMPNQGSQSGSFGGFNGFGARQQGGFGGGFAAGHGQNGGWGQQRTATSYQARQTRPAAPTANTAFHPSARQMGHGVHFNGEPQSALAALGALRQQRIQSVAQPAPGVVRPDTSITWHVGDKARHRKWGVGTVVSVKGTGEEVELKIAFPGQGVKGLMQKYAPIEKV